MENPTYIFDGSMEGFFTIVYNYFYEKKIPENIINNIDYEQKLGAFYINIKTDFVKSEKVFMSLEKKISKTCKDNIVMTFMNKDYDFYMDLFKYMLLGYKTSYLVDSYEHIDYVKKIHTISKRVSKEIHRFSGFLRFSNTNENILYAKFSPENNIIIPLTNYFIDRLQSESFIIHDEKRKIATIFNTVEFALVEVPNNIKITFSDDEELYRQMYKSFIDHIGIAERKNLKLQRQHFPLKYLKNSTTGC